MDTLIIKNNLEKQLGPIEYPTSDSDAERLIEAITPVVRELLNNDFNKLINILYRIDLNETTFKNILHERSDIPLETRLSKAIVNRQLEKLNWRKKYATKNDQESSE